MASLLNLSNNSIYSFSLLLLVISIAINIILALAVLKNDKGSRTNQLYALLCFVLSAWLVAMFLYTQSHNFASATLILAKSTLFLAAPMTLIFFLFAHTIPERQILLKKRSLIISLIGTAAIMLVAISNFSFTGVLNEAGYQAVPGPGMAPFGMLTIFFSFAAIYLLVQKYRRAKGEQKKQYQYVMMGLFLMSFLITATIFFPILLYNNQLFVPLAPLYALLFLGMTAYAVIHHQLFDIKALATEVFVIALAIIFFARLFTSRSSSEFIIQLLVFLTTIFFGYLLIKSVTKEVHQREQLAKLNRRLKRSNMRLEELLEMKSEFVGIVSHQLRTPLTVLRGLLDMQKNGDFKDLSSEKVSSLQDSMLQSAVRLTALINDLMNMTRMEGGINLSVQEVDIPKLLRDIVGQLKGNFDKKHLSVDVQTVNNIPPVEADPKYLHEAFSNLIDNAEKYTKTGGVSIKVRRVMSDVIVTITDTGIGLTEDDKKKLFAKFSRGDRSATIHTEGTGLGLYIVKRIIDSHNGKIAFESPGVDKGTTATVTLPINYEN